MSSSTIMDLTRGDFRTSRAADELNTRFQTLLGLPHRYGPARLALGRSLGIASRPSLELNTLGSGRSIKGEQLFGSGVELAGWLTLLIEHATPVPMDKRELQTLVAAHWHRGVYLLWEDWKASGGEFDAFVSRLISRAHGRRNGRTSVKN